MSMREGKARVSEGIRATRAVEMWGRRFVRFSLHVRVNTTWGGMKREGTAGGRGCAAAISDGAAFGADFERALFHLTRAGRMMVLGVACLGLPIALAGKIAGFGSGCCYRLYEDACVGIYHEMSEGGYGA